MDLGLTGRIAIVTGGSQGIGKAAAASLVREGANVAICARTQETLDSAAEEIRAAGDGEVLTIACDMTDPDQVTAMVEQVVAKWGGVDILVNNAGTSSAHPFEEATDEIFEYDINLKVFGAIRCSRAVLPLMKAAGGGRIINITTPGGKASGARSLPTSLSRAAGISLTKAMSQEFAADNILVNTVCIGLIKSGQHERRYEQAQERDPSMTMDAWYERMGERTPIGRVGEASEAGDVICFLASARASYVTGASVNVDGGTSPVV